LREGDERIRVLNNQINSGKERIKQLDKKTKRIKESVFYTEVLSEENKNKQLEQKIGSLRIEIETKRESLAIMKQRIKNAEKNIEEVKVTEITKTKTQKIEGNVKATNLQLEFRKQEETLKKNQNSIDVSEKIHKQVCLEK
jgi:chromosome segregation ATPase